MYQPKASDVDKKEAGAICVIMHPSGDQPHRVNVNSGEEENLDTCPSEKYLSNHFHSIFYANVHIQKFVSFFAFTGRMSSS